MHDRREFLSLCGLALTTNLQPQAPKNIVIIGAGLAGLAAAQTLSAHHNVVVLEARNRIGGRIHTSHSWPYAPLDLGASWIHGVEGNPITALANQINAKRIITSYDRSTTYATSGKPLSAAQQTELDSLSQRIFKTIRKAQDADSDVSLRQATNGLRHANPNSSTNRLIDFVLNGEIEHEYSGAAENLSTYWFDTAEEFDGEDALFADGFDLITNHLSKGLQIQLNQIVKKIDWQLSPIRITTDSAEFLADQVIVTLPLGVLKKRGIQFTPELPRAKLAAIDKLGFGVLNKCYLRFEKTFWPDNVDWLQYIPLQHGHWTEWVSFQRTVKQPILLGFNAAKRGTEIEQWTDQQIVADAMKTLRVIFGQKIPDPIEHQITRWAADPFSLGSYSYNALGSTPKMRDTLAAPLQQLIYFAGEATERDYFGTAHGAYLSGIRAANQILRA